MQKKLDVITVGAANIDIVARIEKFPGPDDQVFISSLNHRYGGSAANTAVACAKLGLKTGFLGKIADDAMGQELINSFKEACVNVEAIIKVSGIPSGQVFVALDQSGDRRMFTYPGAPQLLTVDEIKERVPFLSSSYMVHMSSLSTPEPHLEVARNSRENGYLLSMNPGAMISSMDYSGVKPIFDNLDMLFVSKNEITRIFEQSDINDNVEACFDKSSVKLIVLTLGDKGSQFFLKDYESEIAPAYEVPVIDTTGAGDAFCGAFLSCMMPFFKKWIKENARDESTPKQCFHEFILEMKETPGQFVKCLKRGNIVSSYVIQKEGAREGFPTPNVLKQDVFSRS
ncbi:MAG: carbohydrate kinase family protein [Candidatus Hodarchaeota archaeon]